MASSTQAEFGALIARLARALAACRLDFMIVGGQAVLVHGEPRLTQDIDVTIAASVDRLDDLLKACAQAGLTPLPDDVSGFVRDTYVLPVADPLTTARVDLIFSDTDFERGAIERAVRIEIDGLSVPFASAEDLLLLKLFAGRPRDIEDAEGIVRRNRDRIDWSYLRSWAAEFSQVPGREELPRQITRLLGEGRIDSGAETSSESGGEN